MADEDEIRDLIEEMFAMYEEGAAATDHPDHVPARVQATSNFMKYIVPDHSKGPFEAQIKGTEPGDRPKGHSQIMRQLKRDWDAHSYARFDNREHTITVTGSTATVTTTALFVREDSEGQKSDPVTATAGLEKYGNTWKAIAGELRII